jgi:uncharacterized RDD family membrane protein YckC
MTIAVEPYAPVRSASRYAGFWVRVIAFMIDGIAIGIIVSAVTVGRGGIVLGDQWFTFVAWRNFIETVIGFAYFTLFWSTIGGGQTLGMRIFGLHVVGADGRPVSIGVAVLRWIGLIISAAAILLGLVWVAFDARKQGWHDKIARTFVVQVGAAEPPVPTTPAPTSTDPRSATWPPVAAATTPHPVARGFTIGLGILGAGLAVTGLVLTLLGDAVVQSGTGLAVIGTLAMIAFVGAIVAWWRPAVSLVAFVALVVAYWLILGPQLGPWYEGLVAATRIGPSAENAYWYDAPAMAMFIASGVILALGSVVAIVAMAARPGGDAA